MKIYFLSSTPCALTLNGVFYGVTDTFERSAEVHLRDGVYALFNPQNAQPLGVFLNEELLVSPPEGFEVYLLKEGAAVYAREFPPLDFTLRPIAQKREGTLLATVYRQGKVQLNVQEEEKFFNATIPPSFDPCEIEFQHGNIALKGGNTLGIYSTEGKPLLVEQISTFEWTQEGLNATLPLSDSLQRVADCSWKIEKNECVLTSFALRQPHTKVEFDENLLAYAFLETVLLKGDYAAFLADEIKGEGENIRAFLGDFLSVSFTNEARVCGLVKKKGERTFFLDYISVEIREGKIVDVRG